MKCEIIRDLLPLYADGLVSDASATAIEEHLAQCPHCRRVYEAMKTEVALGKAPSMKDRAELQPLKKLNRKVKRCIAVVIAAAAFCCVGLFVGYQYFFRIGWDIAAADTKISIVYYDSDEFENYEVDGGVLSISVASRNDGRTIAGSWNEETRTLTVKERLNGPDYMTRKAHCGVTFVDAGHYYASDGTVLPVTEDSVIRIQFEDKTETFYLKDLAEQYVTEK